MNWRRGFSSYGTCKLHGYLALNDRLVLKGELQGMGEDAVGPSRAKENYEKGQSRYTVI